MAFLFCRMSKNRLNRVAHQEPATLQDDSCSLPTEGQRDQPAPRGTLKPTVAVLFRKAILIILQVPHFKECLHSRVQLKESPTQ